MFDGFVKDLNAFKKLVEGLSMRKCVFTFLLIVTVLFFGLTSSSFAEQKVTDLAWGTSPTGSMGHRAIVALITLLDEKMPDYTMSALPTPGAIFSVKAFAKGEMDGFYGADIAFYEMARDIDRFQGFRNEIINEPVQSFWAYTMEVGLQIHARDINRIKEWRDLRGLPVMTGGMAHDVRAVLERAMSVLDVRHRYVELDWEMCGTTLDAGHIRGLIAYTVGERTLPPWCLEAELMTDLAILNPSEEELRLLREGGLEVIEVTTDIYETNVHAETLVAVPFYYGYHVGLEISEEDVYRMLIILEENASRLVAAEPAFYKVLDDMPELQRRGVASSINDARVHPGLARYMKERNVWNAEWDDRIAN